MTSIKFDEGNGVTFVKVDDSNGVTCVKVAFRRTTSDEGNGVTTVKFDESNGVTFIKFDDSNRVTFVNTYASMLAWRSSTSHVAHCSVDHYHLVPELI